MKKIFLFFVSVVLAACSYAQDRTDSLHIAHYDINLNITDFTNHVVYGYADLLAVAEVNALPQIDLDLKRLEADSIFVDGVRVQNFTHEETLLRIPLQTPANQGDTIRVRVYYSGVQNIVTILVSLFVTCRTISAAAGIPASTFSPTSPPIRSISKQKPTNAPSAADIFVTVS